MNGHTGTGSVWLAGIASMLTATQSPRLILNSS